jgi:ABC-type lipoprotein export system ATPase subunit
MSMILQIEQIGHVYQGLKGPIQAVEDVSLKVNAGEFVAAMGPSGCGKTTLLLAAGGLLQPASGRVLVDGQDLFKMTSSQRALFRAAKIGFVFQQFHLVPYLDVFDNVLAPTLALGSHRNARNRACELVERFGLSDRMHHTPDRLSTGERQRVALARAMINSPRLLLADEPTGNLDDSNGEEVFRCLTEFAHRDGAVLMVTHDSRAANYATRTVKMNKGRI